MKERNSTRCKGFNFTVIATFAVALIGAVGNATAQVPNPPRWSVTRELRIDATREDLVSFSNLSVAPNGDIAVPQTQDGRVAIFDANGSRLGNAGRKGAGPGEFQAFVSDMGWIGDTLWVANAGTLRLPIFSRTGTFIRELTAPQPPVSTRRTVSPGTVANVPVIPRTEVVLSGGGAVVVARSGERATGGMCGCTFRMSADGAGVLMGYDPPEIDTIMQRPGGGGSAAPPFAWRPQHDASPDGSRMGFLFSTYSERAAQRYKVVVVAQRGDTAFSKTFGFAGVRIPSAAVDSVINARAAVSPTAEAMRAMLKESTPPFYTPWLSVGTLQGIQLGSDGTTWIGLRATAEGNPWIVLDNSGNPVAQVILPANVFLMEATRQRIWGAEEDSNGLRSVVRYSVSSR